MRFREKPEKAAGRRGLLSASPLDMSQSHMHRARAWWAPSLPWQCLSRLGTGQGHVGIREADTRDSRNGRARPLAHELPQPGTTSGCSSGTTCPDPGACWPGLGAPGGVDAGGGRGEWSTECGSGGRLHPTGPVIPCQVLRRPPPEPPFSYLQSGLMTLVLPAAQDIGSKVLWRMSSSPQSEARPSDSSLL